MTFEALYQQVRGIVHRARKDYYIKTWEVDDWDQEGMLVLYQLTLQYPEIGLDRIRLYTYFKVKFRNHIKDKVRRQESQKRQFDRMAHEEISELSHLIGDKGLLSDDKVLLKDRLTSFLAERPHYSQVDYDQLISGRRFKGRRQLVLELADYLQDFRDI